MFSNYFQGMTESKFREPVPELYLFVCNAYILYGLKKKHKMAIKFMFKLNYTPVYVICFEFTCKFKSLKLLVVAFPLGAQGYGPQVSG